MESQLDAYLDEIAPERPSNPDTSLDSPLPSLQIAKAHTIDTIAIDPKAAKEALANR